MDEVLVNFDVLAHFNRTCGSGNVCTKTGEPHLSSSPGVADKDEVADFKIEEETEYSPELTGAIAAAIRVTLLQCRFDKKYLIDFEFNFTDVFLGP